MGNFRCKDQQLLQRPAHFDQKKIDEAEKQKRRAGGREETPAKRKRRGSNARNQPGAAREGRARPRARATKRAEVRRQRQREVLAQARQLVRDNRIPRPERDDDTRFRFDNKGKVKRRRVRRRAQQDQRQPAA